MRRRRHRGLPSCSSVFLNAFEHFRFNILQIAARTIVTAFIYALHKPLLKKELGELLTNDFKSFDNFTICSRRFQRIPEEPYLKSWSHSLLIDGSRFELKIIVRPSQQQTAVDLLFYTQQLRFGLPAPGATVNLLSRANPEE